MTKRVALPITIIAAALCCFAASTADAANEAVVALKGATIETVGKLGRIENGTVVVRGTKIAAVGEDAEIPDNARVIDVRGKTILPGLVDPYHAIRVAGQATPSTRTFTIRGRTFTRRSSTRTSAPKFLRIVDSFYPYEIDFGPLVRTGITTTNLVASGYGQAALARTTIDRPEAMITSGEGLVFVSISNNTASLDVLRTGLSSTKSSSSSSARRSTFATRLSSSSASRLSSRNRSSSRLTPIEQKLWKQVAEGKRPLIVNANSPAAIVHVLRALEPYDKVNLALVTTGPNVYQTLDQLKGRRLSLILQPTIDLAPNTRDRVCVFAFGQPD